MNSLKVLVAEDNLINQKVVTRMLERLGYQADLVRDGLEVLGALRQQSYDVILMDMYMPNMSGIDAARQICQEWHPTIRPYIVAVTASTEETDYQSCIAAGMDDYISKPIRLEELERVLTNYQTIQAPTTGKAY
jgi:CheY-like chemotaxis protein